jgi:hypothetical protein
MFPSIDFLMAIMLSGWILSKRFYQPACVHVDPAHQVARITFNMDKSAWPAFPACLQRPVFPLYLLQYRISATWHTVC